MSGRIPRQFIDDLLVRVDIVELIDSHHPLKKTGSNFVARCPFHTEKTPSFSVNRSRQMYHCFGCGVSGNAISFLMDFSHLDFVEAVEDLAAFVGVDVPREAFSPNGNEEKASSAHLYTVLEGVAAFYAEQLRATDGSKAIEYLKGRGVSGEIARDFGLGFAPNQWDVLLKRFKQQDLIDAGMLVVKDDGKAYDRFRGRLMFPIRDKRKRVVGFGGRVLDDSLPKYLNSPETAIFSKSKELYGLYELLEKKSRPERILVVEGYMDVIALAQFGVTNAVAALGTATSKTQIELLFRFTSELVFCFDGDNAGRQAAWKATEAALPCLRDGKQIKIMLLPQDQDPDTLIRNKGLDGFEQQIVSAQVLSDYFFDFIGGRLNLATVEGRAQLLAAAKPLLEKIPAGFFSEMMVTRLNQLVGVRGFGVADKKTQLSNAPRGFAQGKKSANSNLTRKVLALLLQYPYLGHYAGPYAANFEGLTFAGQELFLDILRVISLEKPENGAILVEVYRGSEHEKVVKSLAGLELNVPVGGEQAEFSGALAQLLKQVKQDKLAGLLVKESQQGLNDEEKQLLRALFKERL